MQRSALCRSRRELSNEYLLPKFGFDTAENEPIQLLQFKSGLGHLIFTELSSPVAGGQEYARLTDMLVSSEHTKPAGVLFFHRDVGVARSTTENLFSLITCGAVDLL